MKEVIEDLEKLKEYWEKQSEHQRQNYYGDDASIDNFCDDLEELIKKYKGI